MMNLEITKFSKIGGILTKRIALAQNGSIVSDGSACVMGRGTAERVKLAGVADLATLIGKLRPFEAIALGALRDNLPDEVKIATKKKLANAVAQPHTIARVSANICYREGPAFALLDFDTKGMPPEVATKLKQLGDFWPALVSVLPSLHDAARVVRPSTSSGLYHGSTGKKLAGSDGVHVYVVARDGNDAERFLKTLHERCWLAGFGWMMLGRAGQLLDRSIVDRTVGAPERLVFEGPPVVKPPLKQDKKSRQPVTIAGEELDTVAACPPLTIVETARLEELKAREAHRLAPESAKARTAFIDQQAKDMVARTGMSEPAAKQTVLRQCEGVLLPDVVLPFDDEKLAGCTVGDVLRDPDRFAGETLADPNEGIDYGRCKAKILRRADGTPWIHSFAHGRTIYALKFDAAAVRKAVAAAGEDAAKTFARMAVDADLDPVEMDELRRVVAKQSGTGLRAIDSAVKAAQEQSDQRRAKERRNLPRRDPRPAIAKPIVDAPWLPVMGVLNEILGRPADRPPLRDIDGVVTVGGLMTVPGTHAFVQDEANMEEESDDQTSAA